MGTLSYQGLLDEEARAKRRRRHPFSLALVFLLVFFTIQYAWEMSRGTWLERAVIDHGTVVPAALLIDMVLPQQNVTPLGNSLKSRWGQPNIRNGCEGVETLFLLVAAFFAYPFSWKRRLLGIALGVVLVYVLNLARLLVLWIALMQDRTLFGILHGTLLPLVLVVACAGFLLAFLPRHDPQST